MMKNKIIKFKIIGVMAYFIIMLSANPQNLVLEGADEKVRGDIDTVKKNVAEMMSPDNHLESKVDKSKSEIKSENKKNWENLQGVIKEIKNDISKQVEDNEKWKLEVARRLNAIDDSIKLLTRNSEHIEEDIKSIKDEPKTYKIKDILPKLIDINKNLGNIDTRLENLEKKVNERLPEISKSQIKEEDKGEKGLSFIALHLIPIIFITIVILGIVFLKFKGIQAFVFSLFKKDPEGKGSGADEESNNIKGGKDDKSDSDSKCYAVVSNQGRQDVKETITNKESFEEHLIEWWNENVTKKPFQEWEKLLKEEFGKGIIVNKLPGAGLLIGKDDSSKTVYLLPGNVKCTETIAKYFDTETGAEIVSLEKLPVGEITSERKYKATKRGKVKLREEIISSPEEPPVDTNTSEEIPGSAKGGKIQEEEVVKPPLTKSFKEDLLVAWWNREENRYKNGTKNLKECEDSLKKEFGENIVIDVITGNPSDTDDWYIIGIESPESKLSYVIPRRFDFSKEMEKWFSAEKEIDDLKKMVSDLILPAERNMGGNRNMPTKRGKVRLM